MYVICYAGMLPTICHFLRIFCEDLLQFQLHNASLDLGQIHSRFTVFRKYLVAWLHLIALVLGL